jgi:uncharacterized damage-inducible protein DinB
MIDKAWVTLMAQYSRWMNEKLYTHAATLSDEERKADRGAFFKSLHNTLDHIVWADTIWLGRFSRNPPSLPPAGSVLYPEFDALRTRRTALDAEIGNWAAGVDETLLSSPLTWTSRISNQTYTRPTWILVSHFFNHQTHHRGQVSTLLSQYGIDPGVTDLQAMPGLEDIV